MLATGGGGDEEEKRGTERGKKKKTRKASVPVIGTTLTRLHHVHHAFKTFLSSTSPFLFLLLLFFTLFIHYERIINRQCLLNSFKFHRMVRSYWRTRSKPGIKWLLDRAGFPTLEIQSAMVVVSHLLLRHTIRNIQVCIL